MSFARLAEKSVEKLHVFWDLDFERILGRFGEAKILDFRTFFDVLSMSFFKRASEGGKIGHKFEKTKVFRFLAAGRRCTWTSWGEI